ncbi:MAG: FtsX-like permease family protein [Candidatus Marinimicrobia bacterium]|nr:FtsX-like permease family protein [Candidatus Neomarinimicrobiota bacterium]
MVILKLAYRNLRGAGIRTWLNIFVLSIAFLAIIYLKGMYNGMQDQSIRISENTDKGSGQYWCEVYDPYDPLSLPDAHDEIPAVFDPFRESGVMTPVMLYQGAIYPENRMKNVMLRGVDHEQTVMNVPTHELNVEADGYIPVMIGQRMARSINAEEGDIFTMQWRDGNGAYDARDAKVVHVMVTDNLTIDVGNVWLDLSLLQDITRLDNYATMMVVDKSYSGELPESSWTYHSLVELTADIREMTEMKSKGGSIFYGVLMALALLAVFDTQVLSIWRRRKEMGTLMALGMTRLTLIKLFTLEGSMYGIFAAILATIYGAPLLYLNNMKGLTMPMDVDSFGMVLPQTLYPEYSLSLILGTIIVVLITVTITSYIPVRKLAQLKPTDALRGKMS